MDQDETWHASRSRPWPHCVRRGPSSPSSKGAQPPIFGPYLLWPNGWIDQDGTWHGRRPRSSGPGHIVLDGDPAPLPQKGGTTPIFGPFLLWPTGWMNQDATWYGGRPRPKPHCARWGPSSPTKTGNSPQFSAYVYYGQTAGSIKMPLGTEVGLGPDDIVLDGAQLPPPEKGAPIFGICLLWPNGRPSHLLLSSCS